MSSIFEAYDEEFVALTQDIGANISHLTSYETDAGESAWSFDVRYDDFYIPPLVPSTLKSCARQEALVFAASLRLCKVSRPRFR